MNANPKYKVSDRVTIKKRMKVGVKYGGITLLSGMKTVLQGGTFEIDVVSDAGNYLLRLPDSFGYYVSEEMILRKEN